MCAGGANGYGLKSLSETPSPKSQSSTAFWLSRVRLVSRMKGVVELDAGQDRKYVGSLERDQQLKRGQRNGQ